MFNVNPFFSPTFYWEWSIDGAWWRSDRLGLWVTFKLKHIFPHWKATSRPDLTVRRLYSERLQMVVGLTSPKCMYHSLYIHFISFLLSLSPKSMWFPVHALRSFSHTPGTHCMCFVFFSTIFLVFLCVSVTYIIYFLSGGPGTKQEPNFPDSVSPRENWRHCRLWRSRHSGRL